jgi:NTP pyrophosphatase (non-canonical NTP hydrolase)
MLSMNELSEQIHENASKKGFYEDFDNLPLGLKHLWIFRSISLIHSELSEAVEAFRIGKYADLLAFRRFMDSHGDKDDPANFIIEFDENIKDSFEDEIADTIIRILDLCGHIGIDIDRHIKFKMQYNELRPYKHNKVT